ncbi:transporter substrate-binding domain-containing protein [Desulfobacterales bacterium HSG17]|nr:transporter substrate-binding domain-containing protein [Desulfobacterales bacterium HSG17]
MKFQKLTLIFSGLIIFLLFISSSSYAKNDKLRIVFTDWFPYTYMENNKASGFEIDIFKEVMNSMQKEVEFVIYPWERCLHVLKKGDADALISLIKNFEREKFTYFPDENISLSKTMFFTTADQNINFDGNYEKLKQFTIGIIAGFSYGDKFDNANYLKKDKSKNTEMLIKKLIGGRNDIIAENQAVILSNSLKMGLGNKIKVLETPIHYKKLYVGFSRAKKHKKLCDEFSKRLKEFKNTSSYISILDKYGIKQSDMEE